MKCEKLKNYQVLLFGMGNDFKKYVEAIEEIIKVEAVSDSNLDLKENDSCKYEFISPKDIKNKFQNPYAVVTASFENFDHIQKFLDSLNIPNCHFSNLEELNVDSRIIRLSDYVGEYYEDCSGNIIDIDKSSIVSKNSYVHFTNMMDYNFDSKLNRAKNSMIKIGCNNYINNLFLSLLRENNYFVIGDNNSLKNFSAILSDGSAFRVGGSNSFEELYSYICEDGLVSIGNDCIFSHKIEIWQSDTHPIFNLKTNQRINLSEPVEIGNHVWVGTGVKLMAGAYIGNGSMVGAGTISSGRFPENCIVAGNPGRVLRENIFWKKDSLIWI